MQSNVIDTFLKSQSIHSISWYSVSITLAIFKSVQVIGSLLLIRQHANMRTILRYLCLAGCKSMFGCMGNIDLVHHLRVAR